MCCTLKDQHSLGQSSTPSDNFGGTNVKPIPKTNLKQGGLKQTFVRGH
jgi:hypothetical protein